MPVKKAEIIAELQASILRLEGFKTLSQGAGHVGLGPVLEVFPNRTFPTGVIHEFVSSCEEQTAATSGFIAGVVASLMGPQGASLWICPRQTIFPPALKTFGIQPDSVIFVELQNEIDILWAMDEALKCPALTTVIAETNELTFTASRRLQLAVERSQVTGFVIRNDGKKINSTAAVARWRITPAESGAIDGLPGIGHPHWNVELLKVKNGRPGSWNIRWVNSGFESVKIITADQETETYSGTGRKAG